MFGQRVAIDSACLSMYNTVEGDGLDPYQCCCCVQWRLLVCGNPLPLLVARASLPDIVLRWGFGGLQSVDDDNARTLLVTNLVLVGRMTADPSMLVSGRLRGVGSATLAGQLSEGARTWQPGQYLSYHSPPEKTFSRFPIRVPKMRTCAEPSICDEVRLVPKVG
ncbi:hypothetical protein BHM03_00060874 [Ensete ventricosum]|nr:hypothetical protein BHM03_00060874 [Ensete ventricosum]